MTSRGPHLTTDQTQPLLVRGTSVALSAGAGCGKTTVLTERFLRALDGPDELALRNIVALTFTEKAARELRQRIRSVCRARLRGASDEDSAKWRGIVRGLEAAPVTTFHEYCARLLRRHADRAGVDSDFVVLDEVLASPLLDDALARCVRRWSSEKNDDLVVLGIEYGLSRLREILASLASRRDADELAEWSEIPPEEVVGRWRESWEQAARPELLRRFILDSSEVGRLLEENEPTHAGMRRRRLAVLDCLQRFETAADPVGLLRLIRDDARVQGGGTAKNWPSPEVYAQIRDGFTALRKASDALEAILHVDDSTTLRCADLGQRLARLAVEARTDYQTAKREKSGLDFDDLLLKTRDLLRRDARAVREDPGREIRFVLVDEFQDTDPVQSEILEHLTGQSFSEGGLFVVGDFKQSIYRFRGARPEIFSRLRDALPEAGRLALSENFRSGPGIIGFVNALFAEAFYPDRPRLFPSPKAQAADGGPAVQFLWAEEPDSDPENRKARLLASERREIEARWIARVIRHRLEAGWPIVDRETKTVRPATTGDVALLFRALTDLAPYERALEAEGLDYHVVSGSTFYLQQEVQDLVNVLSSIEDPLDAVSLAGALRSPFFALSDESLFWLNEFEGRGLCLTVQHPDDVPGLSIEERRKARRAARLLDRWRGLKDQVPIAALLDRVLDESGYESALLGERLGDRKRANARKFVRLARRFDTSSSLSLGHFVAKLRRELSDPPREGQSATTDEQGKCVRLMSIHQAKGLEFPIVFVPDMNRKRRGTYNQVSFDPTLGPLVRPSGSIEAEDDPATSQKARSLGWTLFEEREAVEDDSEALRLFYVAVTRARDALILSAGVGADAKPEAAALKLLDERFDRQTGLCRASLPPGWENPRVGVIAECPPPVNSLRVRRRRPRLRAVARVISSAPLSDKSVEESQVRLPRSVDLELLRNLPPHETRLDALVRSIVVEPEFLEGGKLEPSARRAARKQNPSANESLIAQALARINPWFDEASGKPPFRGRWVGHEQKFAWSYPWQGSTRPDAEDVASVLFHGIADLVMLDADGNGVVLSVQSPLASPAVERLRLLLAARAVQSISPGHRVRAFRLGEEIAEEDVADQAGINDAVSVVLTLIGANNDRGVSR